MAAAIASGAARRVCLLCWRRGCWQIVALRLPTAAHSTTASSFLLRYDLRPPAPLRACSGKSLRPVDQPPDLTESVGVGGAGLERRSADPTNELRDYIEYSKVNSWHSAVGRSKEVNRRWKYERLVLGVCCTVLLAYLFVRPENSVDEQFGMDEFGKGLLRPHPAMEHHIAATIEAVEGRGGDATLYRQQLKILLKEKELQQKNEARSRTPKLKYDPKLNEVQY